MSDERRDGERHEEPRRNAHSEEHQPERREEPGQEARPPSGEQEPQQRPEARREEAQQPPTGYVAGPGAVEENGELDIDPPRREVAPAAREPVRPSAPPPPSAGPAPGQHGGAQPRPPQQQQPQQGQQQRPGPGAPPPARPPGGYGPQQGPPPPPGAGRPPYGPPQGPPQQGFQPPYGQAGGGGWRPPYGAPGAGGYGPPGGGPPRPPQRNRALPVIVGLVLVFFLITVVLVGVVAGTAGTARGGMLGGLMGERIAILNVEGVIGEGPAFGADTQKIVEQLKSWKRNENIRALVVRVNSGGGAVSATQEVYAALLEFKEETGRPVVASFGDSAASGGYYAALPADEIYANEGSLTGSIGVMLSLWDFQELQSKIGISARSVKSGEFKDIGSGSRDMTEEERELLEEMVVDVFEQFYDAVYKARTERVREILNSEAPDTVTDEEVDEHLRAYSDGRIFSGRQAFEFGMIDGLGTLDDAVARAAELAGIDPETRRVRAPVRPRGLFGTIGALTNRVESLAGSTGTGESVRLEYRMGPF